MVPSFTFTISLFRVAVVIMEDMMTDSIAVVLPIAAAPTMMPIAQTLHTIPDIALTLVIVLRPRIVILSFRTRIMRRILPAHPCLFLR